jgi:hypothetical protein
MTVDKPFVHGIVMISINIHDPIINDGPRLIDISDFIYAGQRTDMEKIDQEGRQTHGP